MSAPDIPQFEIGGRPSGVAETITVTHPSGGGAPATRTYTASGNGVGSHSELLQLAAAYFQAQFGGIWTWVNDPTNKRCELSWTTGSAIDISFSANVKLYLNVNDTNAIPTPFNGAGQPYGTWYPTRPLEFDRARTYRGSGQAAWDTSDEVFGTSVGDPVVLRHISALIDNSAGDCAEYQESLAFLRLVAPYVPFTLYDAQGDAYTDATLLTLDSRQTRFRYDRVARWSRRFWTIDIFATERPEV